MKGSVCEEKAIFRTETTFSGHRTTIVFNGQVDDILKGYLCRMEKAQGMNSELGE